MERAATIASSLEAEHDNGYINRTQSMATLNEPLPQGAGSGSGPIYQVTILGEASQVGSFNGISTLPNTEIFEQLALIGYASNSDKLTFQKGHFSPQWVPTSPHDSSLLGGHTPRSDEGSLTLNELTVLYTTLSNKVESLETELKLTKQTYGAAFTKLIKKELSAAKILVDATRVHTYSRRRRAVSTGRVRVSTAKETISIADVSMPVSTAGMVQESTSSQEQQEIR
nr:hypothetical protein [Tanacetum cinerariifolium]